MAPDVAPIERLEERPIGVDPATIEDEFARIWRETSGAGFDESSIRLRVLNLVGLGRSEGAVDRFEGVMSVLPQRHPCRGLLAISSAAYDRVEATISAHCWRSTGGRRHVCSEEVSLSGGPSRERELASAVLALLVPEVPVSAWFIDALEPDGYLASEVLEAADVVFFDSASSLEPGDAFAAALGVRSKHDVALADLAWGRLETWRDLTAQIFDGDDGPRELAQISSIEIRGGAGTTSAEPLLLASWLISRLDLALADVSRNGSALTATLYDGARGVQVRIVPGALALDELRLRTPDAEFTVQCHASSGHMHVREEWDSGSARRTVLPRPADEASLIGVALDGVRGGAVYEATLRTALALLGG